MMYLSLSADAYQPSLRDEQEGSVSLDLLPHEIRDQLQAWNSEYQPVVQMTREERATAVGLIDDLDRRGMDIASRIETALAPAKVRYYSEGRLRSLS